MEEIIKNRLNKVLAAVAEAAEANDEVRAACAAELEHLIEATATAGMGEDPIRETLIQAAQTLRNHKETL